MIKLKFMLTCKTFSYQILKITSLEECKYAETENVLAKGGLVMSSLWVSDLGEMVNPAIRSTEKLNRKNNCVIITREEVVASTF
jgi:hypothetical protein